MNAQSTNTPPIAFLGCGAMGGAILNGAIESSLFPPERFLVADRNPDNRGRVEAMGVRAVDTAAALASTLNAPGASLMLGVKPQGLIETAAALPALNQPITVCSILAGITCAGIADALQGPLGHRPKVVRVMPNTPTRVRMGVSGITVGSEDDPLSITANWDDAQDIEHLFRAVGLVVRIDESRFDAFTALAGSGPAYLFYLAQAMEQGAAEAGLKDQDMIRRMTAATLRGAAELLEQSGDDPQELRRRVSSKGGMTLAATNVMDDAGMLDVVAKAITAARDRGRELASA